MTAKEFNERWQLGATAAGKRLEPLRRKYEAVLRANARRVAENYLALDEEVTAAADPERALDAETLKVSITARTATERRRMARSVGTPLVGTVEPGYYAPVLAPLSSVQAEAAVKAVRDALNATIATALEEELSVTETADRIREVLTDRAGWEAERLARSDLNSISNATSLRAAQSLGDEGPRFKRWLTANDGSVRDAHAEAEGQTVRVEEPFLVGGFPMDHPGDPVAPYDLWINCRCVPVWLETADAKTAHSFEGGIVEDPIALAADRAGEAMAAAAVDFSEGTMIAVYPGGPDRFGTEAVGGQDESSLHVTLAFLPEGVDGDRALLTDLLADVAGRTSALEGEVGGMGFFAPGPDGMPVIALPDVVGLNELRTAVAAALEASGTTYATEHGFLPHITLAYREEGSESLALDATGLPLAFPVLTLKEGAVATTFPFVSEEESILDEMNALEAASFSEKVRERLADEGEAMPVGSFPIRNGSDLANAVKALGRAKDPAAAKRHVIKRARALDLLGRLPEDWGVTAAGDDFRFQTEDDVTGGYTSTIVTEGPTLDFDVGEARYREAIKEPRSTTDAPIVRERESLYRGKDDPNAKVAVTLPPGLTASGEGLTVVLIPHDRLEEFLNGLTIEPLIAAGAPLAPPDDWFTDPELEAPTPLTVTPEGRVFGHLGEWGKCHTGIGGRCVPIPRSQNGYTDFHTGGLVTASGDEIRVGKITVDTGHAPVVAGGGRAAASHYDNTGNVGAFVRAGEDEFGPWLAGAVRSDATPEMIRNLRANPPSGDWRKLAGSKGLELIAALAVPVPGFPVAALTASGEVEALFAGFSDSDDLALVASAEPDEDDLREWEILEARLDGVEGLAALVEV